MSHYKNVETSREIRLWIGTACSIVGTIVLVSKATGFDRFVKDKFDNVVWKLRHKNEKIDWD